MRNVCLHDRDARDNHLRYAFCTERWISDAEAVVILWEISIVLPYVLPFSRGIIPAMPLVREVPRWQWSDRTGYYNGIVGRRGEFSRIG